MTKRKIFATNGEFTICAIANKDRIVGEKGQDLEKYRYLFEESDDAVVYCYRLDANCL